MQVQYDYDKKNTKSSNYGETEYYSNKEMNE